MFFIKLFTLINLFTSIKSTELAGVAPKIEQHPNSVVVNVTDPVTLECRATGYPKPDITWYKDGKLLHIPKHESDLADTATFKSNKYALIHDSNLFIFAAMLGRGNKSDNGIYNCKFL
jgi:hypothetical protein